VVYPSRQLSTSQLFARLPLPSRMAKNNLWVEIKNNNKSNIYKTSMHNAIAHHLPTDDQPVPGQWLSLSWSTPFSCIYLFSHGVIQYRISLPPQLPCWQDSMRNWKLQYRPFAAAAEQQINHQYVISIVFLPKAKHSIPATKRENQLWPCWNQDSVACGLSPNYIY